MKLLGTTWIAATLVASALGLSARARAAEPAPAPAASWEEIHDEDGIKVWKRQVPGSSFVAFRGRGPVQAPILQVAAVIRDADRETEWMENCVDAATLALKPSEEAVVYHRTGSPAFFIDDRDTVLDVVTSVHPDKKMIQVVFTNTTHPKMPAKDGVVRMPKLRGHWKMRQIDVNTTEVEYQVEADPGGSLPAWLVNLVSKKLPYHTLEGLRRQVKKSGYEKHRFILQAVLDWSAFEMPAAIPSDQPSISAGAN